MGDWSDNLPYERREYAGHFYDTDEQFEEEEEPKKIKGHWIHEIEGEFEWLVCSCCDYGKEGEVGYPSETPFCPMCGADMRGE